MDIEKRLKIIKRNTAEIITEEGLTKLLKEKKKISAYYGTAPTGPVHIGYFATLGKIFDLMKAGIKTKILIADIHAALDDTKSSWGEIDRRAQYYKKCFELAFSWEEKPEFILGSDFQLNHEYQLDVLKISSMATVLRAKRAASEVTRMKEPKVSELIYPIMQALDEQYLGVDIQLGGTDQRHIMAFAREYLPRIDYEPRVEIMMPLITSLKGPGVKMSASIPDSSIKVYESEENIQRKILNAYCPIGTVKDNPLTQICKFIIFPVKGKLKIERDKKYGGDIVFKNYEEFEKGFLSGKIHPADLKPAVSSNLIDIFKKVREYFEKNKEELNRLGEKFLP
jgi:tyrosyl-tRNA synthetase